jgi:arylsulfatase
VILSIEDAARTTVKRTVPGAFRASQHSKSASIFGSPVSLDYFDRRPFAFDGKITTVEVQLK